LADYIGRKRSVQIMLPSETLRGSCAPPGLAGEPTPTGQLRTTNEVKTKTK
jgi:hypothetical protein